MQNIFGKNILSNNEFYKIISLIKTFSQANLSQINVSNIHVSAERCKYHQCQN